MNPKPTKPTPTTSRATGGNLWRRHAETGSTIPFSEWVTALASGLVHVRTKGIEVVTRVESVGEVLGI